MKVRKKLFEKDALQKSIKMDEVSREYKRIDDIITNKIKRPLSITSEYFPFADTLKNSLRFLATDNIGLKSNDNSILDKINQIENLESRFRDANEVRQFMHERQAALRDQLSRLGMVKELKQLNKQVYYYSAQIKEYKLLFKDPRKREQKALELITQTPQFKKFFQEHSELAALFPVPANAGTPLALQGLQTRATIQNIMQQRLQSVGPNAQQYLQQGIQQAQAAMSQLKDKINSLGGMSNDEEIADFKPNTQKTKSFARRLEYGTNLQNSGANRFLPATSDIGISIGYKLNDRSIIGIGASGKIGWGSDIRRINITGQGASLRSFLDWKLKGKFFVSGGYEQNYFQSFKNLSILKNFDSWQSSALLGLSKKYAVGKRLKGEVKLYYDFLYKTHVPASQPVLFRVGYGF